MPKIRKIKLEDKIRVTNESVTDAGKYTPQEEGLAKSARATDNTSDLKSKEIRYILSVPAPWTQAWLDENGLEVVYLYGKAVLRFKK